MSLLDVAKSTPTNRGRNYGDHNRDELADLAIAWAYGELTLSQVQNALDFGRTRTPYSIIADSLRFAVKIGKLARTTPKKVT